ncbi:MAG: YDG domain-containing protein, partial [Candidatus Taylorbacteria bacterium]
GNTSYNAAPDVDQSFSVTTKSLTVTGITAESKPYDGNTTATIDTTGATLVGVVGSDVVTLNTSGSSGTFDNATLYNTVVRNLSPPEKPTSAVSRNFVFDAVAGMICADPVL